MLLCGKDEDNISGDGLLVFYFDDVSDLDGGPIGFDELGLVEEGCFAGVDLVVFCGSFLNSYDDT
jgi:hypothetical protein